VKYIDENRIVFWTVFAVLFFGMKPALFVFGGGMFYNLVVTITRFKKGTP
jgi:hypothetical protein